VSRCSGFSARRAEGGKRPEHKRIVDSVGGNRKSFLPNQARREDHPGTMRLPTTRTSRTAMGPRPRCRFGHPQPSKTHDRSIVDLPEVEQTAAIVHRGPTDNILRIIRTLARSSTQLDTARLIS
jgi:hypothetical protein